MQIVIEIDGKDKTFYTSKVPVMAKRKYLEVMAKNEDKYEENEDYRPSAQEQLDEEIELAGILTDVVFKNQFTIEQLLYGVDDKYLYGKLREAVFGEKPKEQSEGNEQGK